MLWLNPRRVTIGTLTLDHVESVTLDRTGDKVIVEYGDAGPQVQFVDVPERRVTFRIVRVLVADEATPVKPGDQAVLSFRTSPSASGAQVREISATVVITSLEHSVTIKRGAVQTITAIAVSANGIADPVTETVIGGG